MSTLPEASGELTPDQQRSVVLQRVRAALARPTDPRVRAHTLGEHHADDESSPAAGVTGRDDVSVHSSAMHSPWPHDPTPRPPAGPDELLAAFAERCGVLRTRLERAASPAEAGVLLASLAAEHGWRRVACSGEPLAAAIVGGLGLVVTEPGDPASELAECDAGITGCLALVAATGSVMVSAPASGGRAMSVLVPHHVVVATADRLVSDLGSALRLAAGGPGGRLASQVSLITGPSRTGDIERILVLGAHGPRWLTVILIDAA